MKAIQVTRTGGPEVLTLAELPRPKPQSNEAIVQIKASGVNFVDIYFREGRYPMNLPFIAGSEAAGTVLEVGRDVKRFTPGARVAYTGVPGAYAEFAAVPADRLVAIPEGLEFRDAAALMLQGMTAHYLTRSTYLLKAGDTCLVHAAAGGMGLLLVQIAKLLGARVIGTVGSDAKAELARKAGADHVIVYTRQDFMVEVKRLTDGKGVNVVYDGVGKDTFEGSLQVLQPRGYMVLYGAASGPVPPFDLARLTPLGSLFVTRPSLAHHIATREELERRSSEVFNWVKEKRVHVTIGKTYPLEDAAQAHRDLEGRRTTGKLLLIP